MEKDGVILACMYSWNCEHASIFKISEELKSFVSFVKKGGNGGERIRTLLAQLSSFKHYKNIAALNGIKDSFDPRVVSSYWTGDSKLEGGIHHNYTTLEPLLKTPIGVIHAETVDECFVHPAKVIKVKKNLLVVEYQPVKKNNNKLVLAKPRRKEIKNAFVKKIWTGGYITTHFSDAVETITFKEFGILKAISLQSLAKFNGARFSA